MKLHAGSLYRNFLVLYGDVDNAHIIQVDDDKVQWDIYCNDVEFDPIDLTEAEVVFEERSYKFKYQVTKTPMKDLGL